MREYSIGFASCNRPKSLERGLKSVSNSKYDFKSKIVVDDNSTKDNIEYIKKACRDNEFTLILKNSQRGLANSWNILTLYLNTRHIILNVDDISYNNESSWLEFYENGFDYECERFYKVCLFRTSAWAMNKSIIPKIGWYDERFPFAVAEDTDWEVRLKEFFYGVGGNGWVNYPSPDKNSSEQGNDYIIHGDEPGEIREWVNPEKFNKNLDFFIYKWEIDKEELFKQCPELNDGRNDRELVYEASRRMLLIRRIEDIDYYPLVTKNYNRGIFSAIDAKHENIKEFIKN